MKNHLTLVAIGMAACAISASGQTLPVAPETAGLMPKTATGWINGTNGINNFSSEALSMDMANNGHVIIGWEDDAEGTINHFLGVWTMVDGNGNMITPMTVQT
ncbi:MAG: hypothetical protein IH623_24845, partial [Verrucomicrobia bacterium]|nr:hypothetical protein [Verrucomicrobiota bacterium]